MWFMHCSSTSFQKKFLWLLPFSDWGFIVSHCLGREKVGVFQCQHTLGIGGFNFRNWGSRELARKSTRLPHYFHGFLSCQAWASLQLAVSLGAPQVPFWSSGGQWEVLSRAQPPGEHRHLCWATQAHTYSCLHEQKQLSACTESNHETVDCL